ncbi:MAG: hypothetical protein DME23_24675 [Verrucomicrobia bacterium]|nr:MAG: hypothetical protein DME23_24675 [Verrucomicrobiota bacterium]
MNSIGNIRIALGALALEGNYHQRPLVPPILEPPADQQLAFHAFAVGVQIYTWTPNPTNPALFSWVFKAPEAVLFKADDRDDAVGLHYAGPTWEHKDGSKVVGTVLQRSPSAVPNAIPWLLLQAVSNAGHGKLSDVTYIQRVNTTGGTAPTAGGDATHLEARVPYTAEYYFYRAHRSTIDEVTEWNRNMLAALFKSGLSPLVATRAGAIVSAAVYDAVNGIDRHYEPIHVAANAPRGASQRAAAVQAAYASLVNLFPTQKPDLDAQLAVSLSAIAGDEAAENSQSVMQGIDWGQAVADAIWAWRSTDGFTPAPPAFLGGSAVGQWRPTPPAMAPGAGPQFAYMTPWAISSPSQFRPAGPPALTSARYTADFKETKSMGSASSSIRTADESIACQFWAGSSVTYFWNRVAVSLMGAERHTTLLEKSRLLALLNIALADAAIACWDAKYTYVFWRPVTAITLGATDGNPLTIEDSSWTPSIVTPAHPEYPSGHSTASGAAAALLAEFFGEETSLSFDSDVMIGVTRSFTSFSAALDEIKDARIFGGIHFRAACNDGQATGQQVANYILKNSLLPLHGKRGDRGGEHGEHHGRHGDRDD